MTTRIALIAFGVATLIAPAAMAQTQTQAGMVDDPAVNVRQSQNYNSLVDHDAGFRAERMRRECGSIEGDDLRRQCMESFGAAANSGTSDSRTMRGSAGRGTR